MTTKLTLGMYLNWREMNWIRCREGLAGWTQKYESLTQDQNNLHLKILTTFSLLLQWLLEIKYFTSRVISWVTNISLLANSLAVSANFTIENIELRLRCKLMNLQRTPSLSYYLFLQLYLHRTKHLSLDFFPASHLVDLVLIWFNIRNLPIHPESLRPPLFIGSRNKICFHLNCF